MMLKIIAFLLVPIAFIASLFVKPVPAAEPIAPLSEALPEDSMKKYDKINGLNGSEFYIARPKPENLGKASSADFGMSEENEDNSKSFDAALAYCREHPGTELIIEPGRYFFKKAGHALNGLSNILISGSGAEFIFSEVGTQMEINACDTLEINGLIIDWDRENDPIEDIVKISSADKKAHFIDMEFLFREPESADMIYSALSQCDPDGYTFGAEGCCKEAYLYMTEGSVKSAELINKNTVRLYHDGQLDNFAAGETYILRHYVYGGGTFATSGGSKNITFDGVKLYGSTGSGYYFGGRASHFQIINSVIGVAPGLSDRYFVSLGADAIHIANSNGCFRIENCDISRQGDDALNVHDGLAYIDKVEGNTVYVYASAFLLNVGDTVKFKDSKFNDVDFTAKIAAFDGSDTLKKIVFDKDVSGKIFKNYIAVNSTVDSGNYVIRGNYIHENRARGLLLQSSNGLCESNRFYKTEMQAIKIIMDIIPSLWQEGTGVNGLEITGNTFEKCDYINCGEQITIGTSIDGSEADCMPFTNVGICKNTFSDFTSRLITANNINGLRFCDNVITANNRENRMHFGKFCENIDLSGNTFDGTQGKNASAVISESLIDFINYNTK